MPETTQADRDEALEFLRSKIKPDETVIYIMEQEGRSDTDKFQVLFIDPADQSPWFVTRRIGVACGIPLSRNESSLLIGGGGYSKRQYIVESLSRALWPDLPFQDPDTRKYHLRSYTL